jgi:hypothetical protein
MLGLPLWAWVILAIIILVMVVVRSLYSRWRGMCRGVRDDLTALLEEVRPEVSVLREEMGNLVVQMEDGTERVWEMEEVYAEVAGLPGWGRDREQRAPLNHRAVASLFAPPADGPLSLAVHGEWMKPLLVPQNALEQSPEIVHTPLPKLGLAAIYVLDLPQAKRHLTEQDCTDLGINVEEIHGLALANLGKNFRSDAIAEAGTDSGSAIQYNDSFDATRLLLVPECLQPGQELVAVIPHRDMLALLPGSMREDPEKLQQAIGVLECGEHPPLLNRAVSVTRDGFELI